MISDAAHEHAANALIDLLRARLRALAKAMAQSRAALGAAAQTRKDEAGETVAAVHGLRVACRRAGVALRVASELIAPEEAGRLRRRIRAVRRAAGAVRDCDVQQRLLDHLTLGATGVRVRAAELASRLMQQDRIVAARGLADVLERIAPRQMRRARLTPAVPAPSPARLAEIHASEQAGRVLASSRRVGESPEVFHSVRLDLKALRYTMEILVRLVPEGQALALRDSLLPVLVEAQERMGAANDISSLTDRLGRYASSLATTHHSERLTADVYLESDVRDLHDRFAQVRDLRLEKAAVWWQQIGLPNLLAALPQAGITPLPPKVEPAADSSRPRSVSPSPESSMQSVTHKRENGASGQGHVSSPAGAGVMGAGQGTTHMMPQPATPQPNLHPEAARQRDLWLSGRKLAVIDIGSNSIRLLAVELVDSQTWTVLAEERAMTRLAQGMAANREISSDAMARSVEAIGRFKVQAERLGVQGVRAFATAAVREASNKRDFISLVQDRTGLLVELVSARDEGRLTHLSVSRVYDLSRGAAGVIDIGGGSLEVVESRDGIITANTSMPLGAVRLTEAFGGANAASGKNFGALRHEAERQIKRHVRTPETPPGILVGCGGTFTTLLTLAAATRGVLIERNSPALSTLGPVTREQLKSLLKHLRGLSLEQRLRVPGLPSDRADIVVAGLVVVERLMKRLGATQLHVHPGGFREGLVLRLIEDELARRPNTPATPADLLAGVRRLGEACHFDKPHSEHVANLALSLFDQFRSQSDIIHGLGADGSERVILHAAALLHDVGVMVNYKGHHKHSCTIIRHASLPGFSARQIELIANIARYHRKGGPKESHRAFASLSDRDRLLVSRLAALLRVADGLDRAHAQATETVHVRFGNGIVHIEPMGSALREEDLAAAGDKADLLREVTGSEIDIQPGRVSPASL